MNHRFAILGAEPVDVTEFGASKTLIVVGGGPTLI